MLKSVCLALSAAVLIAGCSTGTRSYGPAGAGSSFGYSEQPIEAGRYQVSYRAETEDTARQYALLRAAEVTSMNGAEWFRIVNRYSSGVPSTGRSGPSVSVGGSVGSGGYSGVGIGIGFPIGGGGRSSGNVVHTMEIVTGSGPKPQDVAIYDAADVIMNLRGS
ncbi:MAG: hypothetical protein CMK07_16850 [Ponticaulis sp.]|nr:hypothetical protein [Ponticaulis sp.]